MVMWICKKKAFFGVRACTPIVFRSGIIEPDCLCPEGKPCLVGNGDTPLCSTRFWLGHCNPEGSECVPQLQISVREAKTLFPYATPTPDNGLGGPCEIGVGVDCQDFDTALTCSTACLSKVATPLPEFDGDHHLGVVPSPTFLPREVNPLGLGNVDGVCSYIPGSQGVGDCCLCQTDCASGLQCYMVKSGALATLPVPDMSLLEDLSVTGTCLVPPAGAFQPAGAPQSGSGVFLCKKPNGLPCFDNSHCISGMCENPGPNGKCIADIGDRCVATIQCVAPAVCHIPAGWNKGHCLLPNFESCAQDENCVSGVCGDVGGGMVCLALKGEPCYPLASGGIVPNFNCAPGLECSDMVTGVGVCQLP
ncbi:MAG: hypothetical protein MHM6MM_001108 [Cercozoa sp. M6MM]